MELDLLPCSHHQNIPQNSVTAFNLPSFTNPSPFCTLLLTDNKYPHHKTGHYRNKSSKIWDPHPRYEINANGHSFVLNLRPESDYVAPNLEVSASHIFLIFIFVFFYKIDFIHVCVNVKRRIFTRFLHLKYDIL